MKQILMDQFQEPDSASTEMCMVLTALLALSDTFYLRMYRTSRPGYCLMRSPYQRPRISTFFQWMQDPSQLHLGWDVIETLICSFQAVYCPRIDGTAVPAMHAFSDSVKPAIQGSSVPDPYYQYWRQRQRRHLSVKAEEVLNSETHRTQWRWWT